MKGRGVSRAGAPKTTRLSAAKFAGKLAAREDVAVTAATVGAFGIQSHIGNDGHIQAAQHQEWRKFVEQAVAMGYRLLITELDVNDKDLPGAIPARDAQVAAAAREYLDLMLSFEQLDQVLCWGMVDKYSWLQNFSPRQDKMPQRPCRPSRV